MTVNTQHRELRHAIASFYDDYHRQRVRRADDWMQRNYWGSFRGRILEFGGGTLFPAHRANEYCLIDLSKAAAKRAAHHGIGALVADGGQAPFISRSFDTVACYDVLEHVINPEAFLSEMCRLARDRVVIAGPNYIGQHTGGMSRYLPLRLLSFVAGDGKSCQRLEDPHLTFDEQWGPDKDAIAAPNAGWVADRLREQGFHISRLHTWDYAYSYLDYFPALRCLGLFMFVVAERR